MAVWVNLALACVQVQSECLICQRRSLTYPATLFPASTDLVLPALTMARTQSNQPVRRSSRLNPTRHQTRPIFDGVLLNRLTNKSAYHGPASRLSAGNVGFESPPQRTIRLSEIVLSETPPPAPAQPESNHSEYDPDNVANQDNASESQPDVHFNLPFMQEWTLVDPSALAPDLYSAATNFSNPPMDVDRWEIALSPTAFSNRFPFVLTMV